MVSRRPLVIKNGFISELLAGDSVRTSDEASLLVAGSGLVGGGDASSDITLQVGAADAASGVIYVGNSIGLDGSDIVQADTAYASGTAAQIVSSVVLSSGNAALATANTALASGNAALALAAGIGGDTYKVVYTASNNVSVGDLVGVDDTNRVAPIFSEVNPNVRTFNTQVASGTGTQTEFTCEPSGSFINIGGWNSSQQYYFQAAQLTGPNTVTYVNTPTAMGSSGSTYQKTQFRQVSSTQNLYNLTTFAFTQTSTSSGQIIVSYRNPSTNAYTTNINSNFSGGLWVTGTLLTNWNNKGLVMAYQVQDGSGGSRTCYVVLGQISGTTCSLGTPLAWYSGSIPSPDGLLYDPDGNKVLLVENNNVTNGRVMTFSISGTTLTASNAYNVFNTLPIADTWAQSTNMAYMEDISRFVFVYRTLQSGTYYIAFIIGYWNGSTYTFGTPTILITAGSTYSAAVYDKKNSKLVLKVYGSSGVNIIIASVTGASLTELTIESNTAASSVYFDSFIDYSYEQDVVVAENTPNPPYILTMETQKNVVPKFSAQNNFVGVATTAAASGSQTTVSVPGGVDYSRTGLTPGSFYYPDPIVSGSLTTSSTTPTSWTSVTSWRAPLRAVSSSGLMVLDSI